MNDTSLLRARYPYMFKGQHIGLTFYRGWTPVLVRTCEQIDGILGANRLGFRWVELGSDRGGGLFVYLLGEDRQFVVGLHGESRRAMMVTTYDVAGDVTTKMDRIVLEAERVAGTACMVCGGRAERALHFGVEVTLCASHSPESLNSQGEEGLEGLWREAIEWEEAASL